MEVVVVEVIPRVVAEAEDEVLDRKAPAGTKAKAKAKAKTAAKEKEVARAVEVAEATETAANNDNLVPLTVLAMVVEHGGGCNEIAPLVIPQRRQRYVRRLHHRWWYNKHRLRRLLVYRPRRRVRYRLDQGSAMHYAMDVTSM